MSYYVEKLMQNLTPFPTREGGKVKASLVAGERFGEGFSKSCGK
jgi:hypothetical protein